MGGLSLVSLTLIVQKKATNRERTRKSQGVGATQYEGDNVIENIMMRMAFLCLTSGVSCAGCGFSVK
jgi:hypothetical protein